MGSCFVVVCHVLLEVSATFLLLVGGVLPSFFSAVLGNWATVVLILVLELPD